MYSTVEEAFDNPLRQQMQRMDRENNINNHKASLTRNIEQFQEKFGLTPPHMGQDGIEGYVNEDLYPSVNLPFFNAQGGFNNSINNEEGFNGTTLSELKRQEEENYDDSFFNDTLSMLDSNYSDLALSSESDNINTVNYLPKNDNKTEKDKVKVKLSHNYCIEKFLKSIVDDGNDMLSLASSEDDLLYDHIKSCKYCKSQIHQKMKMYYDSKPPSKKTTQKEVRVKEPFELPEKIFGYNVKEIIIIIAVSIMIIFILDLLVRIGRKTIKDKR